MAQASNRRWPGFFALASTVPTNRRLGRSLADCWDSFAPRWLGLLAWRVGGAWVAGWLGCWL
eukprot:3453565-Prorocentrum_lima.AAC.1